VIGQNLAYVILLQLLPDVEQLNSMVLREYSESMAISDLVAYSRYSCGMVAIFGQHTTVVRTSPSGTGIRGRVPASDFV
jgi:hypothetical protein